MKYRTAEIFCVICAVAFIVFSVVSHSGSKKTADEIYNDMSAGTSFTCGLELKDNSYFKNTFGISANEFESVVYYSCDDVMNVNEFLIIKFADGASSDEIVSAVEKYVTDNYNIFSGYAPQQGELLKNYVLETNSNTLFFYVGGESEAAQDAFHNAL